MSFTNTQKATLVEITRIDINTLNTHLTYYADYITSEIETNVGAKITTWNTLAQKQTRVKPTGSNYGADIDYDRNRKEIRQYVCDLLLIANPNGARLMRG